MTPVHKGFKASLSRQTQDRRIREIPFFQLSHDSLIRKFDLSNVYKEIEPF